MRRVKTRWVIPAMLVLHGLVVPSSAEAATYSVRYAVAPVQDDRGPSSPPAPHLAPLGMFSITPRGTTVRVTIKDDVAPNGSFLFKICQKNQKDAGDSYCGKGHDDRSTGDICYRGPKTLRDVEPGNVVEIALWWSTGSCPDAPITGTLTVVG